jgi:tetratricopeptide (TPR) repeat protein
LSTALSPWSRPRFSVAPNHLLVGPAVLRVQGVFLWDRAEAELEGDGEEARKLRAEASEHFLAAAKLNPNDGVPFRFLGHHYARGGDNQRAVKCYHRAVTLNPDDSEAGVCVGICIFICPMYSSVCLCWILMCFPLYF